MFLSYFEKITWGWGWKISPPPPTIVIGLTKCKNAPLKKGGGEIDKDAQIDKVNILERIYIYTDTS